jgi:hypothetical protein
MRRRITAILPIALALSTGCASSAPESAGDRAVVAATHAYVRAHTAVDTARVTIEATEGDFARVRLYPLDAGTDPAVLFLRRGSEGWEGVLLGTAFTPEDYDRFGIPPALRLDGP